MPEPTHLIDPSVVRRREFHKAASEWLAKLLPSLQTLFALIGFFIVLLPTLSNNWREVIEKAPLTARIFEDFSSLSGLAMSLLFFLMGLFLVWSGLKSGLPRTKSTFTTNNDALKVEIYPQNKREELIYWLDFVFAIVGTTLWLFLPFGVLAYFIRMGN